MAIEVQSFDKLPDGRSADLFTIVNQRGTSVRLTNFGGIVTQLWVPDRHGRLADVVLGCDRVEDYLRARSYLGALIGRFGNRIAHGRFTLDDRTHQLAVNWKGHHLHGGNVGYDKVLWRAQVVDDSRNPAVRLQHRSPDGDEAYPGNLDITVTISLTKENTLRLEYEATCDRPTPCNLTHHGYFNLAGHDRGDVLDHVMTIHGDAFTPTDDLLIPTGELRDVAGTPFDFRTAKPIGRDVDGDDEQLRHGGGYDHNWVLRRRTESDLEQAAHVHEPSSGRVMEVWTTEPGVQFYVGNFLDVVGLGKEGCSYPRRSGFCLETQHFPDSVNQPGFPSCILRPGQTYRQVTEYRFSCD
ncbi:MAG: galactose mutarotase [Phycisphaeraceae bacterium]|nr:galactose mutarotase [Phycisphaeraceae bacterium]